MRQQQIIFPAARQVELNSTELPPLAPDEWILKAETSLVSTGTELIVWNGEFEANSHWANWVRWPFAQVGYNTVGRVEAVGETVKEVQIGERFASRTPHASRWKMKGGPHAKLVRVPDAIPSENAAWFGMASIAQIGFRRAKLELGDAVAIIGAGILGQLLVQYARLAGAREVILIDTAPARLELARQNGATKTLEMLADQARDEVFAVTNGRGADVVFDVTGHPAAFSAGLHLVRDFGKFVLLGDAPNPGEQRLSSDVIRRGVAIVGAHDNFPNQRESGHDFWQHDEMTRLFFTFLGREQMNVANLVTHRFDFSQAPEVYETLWRDRSNALGVLFDWTKSE